MFDARVLLAALALGLALRQWNIVKCVAVLAADWGILQYVVSTTGDQYCVPLYLAVDIVAAEMILVGMASRWEAALLLTYAIEIVAHGLFAFSTKDATAQYRYWWTLNDLAWLQVAVCLAWAGGEGGSRIRHRLDRRRDRDFVRVPLHLARHDEDRRG